MQGKPRDWRYRSTLRAILPLQRLWYRPEDSNTEFYPGQVDCLKQSITLYIPGVVDPAYIPLRDADSVHPLDIRITLHRCTGATLDLDAK